MKSVKAISLTISHSSSHLIKHRFRIDWCLQSKFIQIRPLAIVMALCSLYWLSFFFFSPSWGHQWLLFWSSVGSLPIAVEFTFWLCTAAGASLPHLPRRCQWYTCTYTPAISIVFNSESGMYGLHLVSNVTLWQTGGICRNTNEIFILNYDQVWIPN